MRPAIAACTALLVLGAVRVARADESSDREACFEQDRYDACFRHGKARYTADDYEAAYAAYAHGFELKADHQLGGNLGNLELRLGKYADAYHHLRFSLDNLPPTDRGSDVERALDTKLKEALQHVGARKIVVSPRDASVEVDGEVVELSNSRWVGLLPGSHRLRISAEGHTSVERELRVVAGSEEVVDFTLVPLAASSPAATPDGPEPQPAGDSGGMPDGVRFGVGTTGVVLGAAGIAAGIALVVVSGSKGDEAAELQTQVDADTRVADNACGDGPVAVAGCSELEGKLQDEIAFRNGGIVSLALGAVLAAGGLTLLLIDDGGEGQVAARVLPSRHGLVMGLGGSF